MGERREGGILSCILSFWSGPNLDKLMEQLRGDLTTNPPLIGSYKPTKGSQCIAKFVDGLW